MTQSFKIEVPNDYFARAAAREYSDNAGMALIREFAQNSADAEATEVRFDFLEGNVLRVIDNGNGCNEQRVRNSLLKPLGSAKEGDSVGGFGKAKELLYFANPAWAIETQDVTVLGSFLDVKMFKTGCPVRHGFRAEVQLPPALYTAAKGRARWFLQCSERPGVQWFLDGQEVPTVVDRSKRATRDFGFAKAYLDTDMPNDNTVYLRTGGLLTGTRWGAHTGVGRVVIELVGKSFDLLTPARDWFRFEDHRRLIDAWISQLATNHKAAVAEELGDEVKFIDLEPVVIDDVQAAVAAKGVAGLGKGGTGSINATFSFEGMPCTDATTKSHVTPSEENAESNENGFLPHRHVAARTSKPKGFDMSLLPVVHGLTRVVVHTGGKEHAKAASKWLKKNGVAAHRLLAGYATAVKAVAALNDMPTDSIGFTFKPSIEAEFIVKDKRFAVLLNPMRLDLNAGDLAQELLDLALHEMAHAKSGEDHNERFVLTEFDLRRKVRSPRVVGAVNRAIATGEVQKVGLTSHDL